MSAATEVEPWQGKRFVLVLYSAIVLVGGVFGFVIGLARPEDLDPDLFFVIQLPPTALGMAVYGVVTVGVSLGVLLLAVNYVGQKYDTERLDGEDD